MSSALRIIAIVLLVLLLVLAVGPFLIPVPPLTDTVPPEQLADPDSRFIEVNGLQVHYKTAGSGQPVMILLHGFGASLFSWREVMQPLAAYGTVIAYDRPAFGLTERPLDNPAAYSTDANADLLIGLMDQLGVGQAILIGNSAGGTVAFAAALKYPERVQALVAVDAAIYEGGGGPAWLRPLLATPQANHLGPLLVRSIQTRGSQLINMAWYDPTKITPEVVEGYRKPLRADHWDEALWQFTRAARPADISGRLGELKMPVLVITGDTDRIVPTESSIRLAGDIPGSTLVVIPKSGHVPHEETPEAFMQAVGPFISTLAR